MGGVFPLAGDDAVINLTAAGAVTLNSSLANTVHSVTTNANTSLSLGNDNLTLVSTSTIGGGLTQSGGTLTGAGNLTVSGQITWTGGTMSGTGVTNANGGLAIGLLGVYDQMFLTQRTLNSNYGLYLASGATLDNTFGSTFKILDNASINANGGAPAGGTFANEGTLSKTGGVGTSYLSDGITLNNTGVIQAASGVLNLQGAFSNFSTATNTLTGGSYVVSATLQFTNANIVTNAAAISLIGTASKIIDNGSLDALRGFATNTAAGAFTIQGGRT